MDRWPIVAPPIQAALVEREPGRWFCVVRRIETDQHLADLGPYDTEREARAALTEALTDLQVEPFGATG